MEETQEQNVENKQTATTLNVLCAICSEFFKNTDIIESTTKCGHVFHRQCLYRWVLRSNTCPQCRARVHKRSVHRIYLNFTEPTSLDDVEVEPVRGFEWLYVDESMTEKELSEFGFVMGLDKAGDPIYAARVALEDDILPCCYMPKAKGVYAAWNCEGHFLTEGIEILDISNDNAEYKWVSASNGEVPENALETGYCETGEILYTAQAVYKDKKRFGKLHPSHGCAYLPYKRKEVNNRNYKVLVRIPKVHTDKPNTDH